MSDARTFRTSDGPVVRRFRPQSIHVGFCCCCCCCCCCYCCCCCRAIILFVFALSLSGVLDIGNSLTGIGSKISRADGYTGSFFSGILATVVSTPCMAPFLGVAVGTALTMDWLGAYAVFTCIALGLSLPYLLLSIFPAWVSKLPKPGEWMETFKQFMAFPMYATVIWLLWTLQSLL